MNIITNKVLILTFPQESFGGSDWLKWISYIMDIIGSWAMLCQALTAAVLSFVYVSFCL